MNIPLFKQIAGAVAGAAIALALYTVWQAGSPYLGAYLIPPGDHLRTEHTTTVRFANKNITEQSDRYRLIAERTRKIATDLAERRANNGLTLDESPAVAPMKNPPTAFRPPAIVPLSKHALDIQNEAKERAQDIVDQKALEERIARYNPSSASSQSSSSTSSQCFIAENVHSGAPTLPTSGIGSSIAALAALLLSLLCLPTVRRSFRG